MKTPDKKAKDKLKAEKLKIRVIGRTPEKVKKWPTGEFELFKKIAMDRSTDYNIHTRAVLAKHISTNWGECYKQIALQDLNQQIMDINGNTFTTTNIRNRF